MPASNIKQISVKAPVLEFDDSVFQVDDSKAPTGIWRNISCLVYSPPGRGKSSFLKSVVDHWGAQSIVAMDIEKRLYQLGVPRITPPPFSELPEEDHYKYIFGWWDQVLDRAEKRAAPFNPQCRVFAIDTVNTLWDLIFQADLARHMLARTKVPDRADWKYEFQWYTAAYNDFLYRFDRMLRLVDEHDYSVILNCHVALKHRQIDGADIDQWEPELPPGLFKPINKKIHTAFYLKASDGTTPNYFVTTALDSIPAKDQTNIFPKTIWPTWKAIEACQLGEDWTSFKPLVRLIPKKEEAKK